MEYYYPDTDFGPEPITPPLTDPRAEAIAHVKALMTELGVSVADLA